MFDKFGGKTAVVAVVLVVVAALFLAGCKSKKEKCAVKKCPVKVVDGTPLTAEERAKLTPDDVLNILKKGNKEFVEGKLTVRNTPKMVRLAADGQFPKAVVVSCLDSRIPAEDVFHRALGDMFVARIAGNFVNTDILGSLEFACRVAGAKLIVVLGHESCGAVNAAIDNVELGNITALLSNIRPAVTSVEANFQGEKSTNNLEFVEAVLRQNVKQSIEKIRTNSEILREMEQNGEIKIVGGIYRMATGKVDFFQ